MLSWCKWDLLKIVIRELDYNLQQLLALDHYQSFLESVQKFFHVLHRRAIRQILPEQSQGRRSLPYLEGLECLELAARSPGRSFPCIKLRLWGRSLWQGTSSLEWPFAIQHIRGSLLKLRIEPQSCWLGPSLWLHKLRRSLTSRVLGRRGALRSRASSWPWCRTSSTSHRIMHREWKRTGLCRQPLCNLSYPKLNYSSVRGPIE